jgi:single-strand DNA-binding protein
MKSFNQCVFVGNVGTLPEERAVNEVKVCQFSLGVHAGKGEHEKTMWLTVVAWRKLAEIATAYIKVGDLVLVTGKLSVRTYADKQQAERTRVEVIASDITFLGPKKEATAEAAPVSEPERKHESRSAQQPGTANVLQSVR